MITYIWGGFNGLEHTGAPGNVTLQPLGLPPALHLALYAHYNGLHYKLLYCKSSAALKHR